MNSTTSASEGSGSHIHYHQHLHYPLLYEPEALKSLPANSRQATLLDNLSGSTTPWRVRSIVNIPPHLVQSIFEDSERLGAEFSRKATAAVLNPEEQGTVVDPSMLPCPLSDLTDKTNILRSRHIQGLIIRPDGEPITSKAPLYGGESIPPSSKGLHPPCSTPLETLRHRRMENNRMTVRRAHPHLQGGVENPSTRHDHRPKAHRDPTHESRRPSRHPGRPQSAMPLGPRGSNNNNNSHPVARPPWDDRFHVPDPVDPVRQSATVPPPSADDDDVAVAAVAYGHPRILSEDSSSSSSSLSCRDFSQSPSSTAAHTVGKAATRTIRRGGDGDGDRDPCLPFSSPPLLGLVRPRTLDDALSNARSAWARDPQSEIARVEAAAVREIKALSQLREAERQLSTARRVRVQLETRAARREVEQLGVLIAALTRESEMAREQLATIEAEEAQRNRSMIAAAMNDAEDLVALLEGCGIDMDAVLKRSTQSITNTTPTAPGAQKTPQRGPRANPATTPTSSSSQRNSRQTLSPSRPS